MDEVVRNDRDGDGSRRREKGPAVLSVAADDDPGDRRRKEEVHRSVRGDQRRTEPEEGEPGRAGIVVEQQQERDREEKAPRPVLPERLARDHPRRRPEGVGHREREGDAGIRHATQAPRRARRRKAPRREKRQSSPWAGALSSPPRRSGRERERKAAPPSTTSPGDRGRRGAPSSIERSSIRSRSRSFRHSDRGTGRRRARDRTEGGSTRSCRRRPPFSGSSCRRRGTRGVAPSRKCADPGAGADVRRQSSGAHSGRVRGRFDQRPAEGNGFYVSESAVIKSASPLETLGSEGKARPG